MSTLTVKELAAPAGFDLTLASGETLDLSGGTVTLPSSAAVGKLVGFKSQIIGSSNISTTSTTYAEAAEIAYTPQSSSSTIIMTYFGQVALDQGSAENLLFTRWNRDSETSSTNILSTNEFGHYAAGVPNWTLFGSVKVDARYVNTSTTAKTFRFWYRRQGSGGTMFLHRSLDSTVNYITIQEFKENT
tara:strand:+ start:90 stop:653 length:564 start_codon:yes stop_codon:yes gene_type:complete